MGALHISLICLGYALAKRESRLYARAGVLLAFIVFNSMGPINGGPHGVGGYIGDIGDIFGTACVIAMITLTIMGIVSTIRGTGSKKKSEPNA